MGSEMCIRDRRRALPVRGDRRLHSVPRAAVGDRERDHVAPGEHLSLIHI